MEIIDFFDEWLGLLPDPSVAQGYHADFIKYRNDCIAQAERECNKVVKKYAKKVATRFMRIYKKERKANLRKSEV